jgi:hypothetical protein
MIAPELTSTPFRDCPHAPGAFAIAAELVTARGLVTTERGRALVEKARGLAADPRIDVLSITDNPDGHAMLAPDTLGTDLLSRGQKVVIHLACKDWDRSALESRGWAARTDGLLPRLRHHQPHAARARGRPPRHAQLSRHRQGQCAGAHQRLGQRCWAATTRRSRATSVDKSRDR